MGKFTLFCILALVVAFVAPAYAEVQNVKVSGDITARYLYRDDLDLDSADDGTIVNAGSESDDFFMSTIGVNVAADLTDNVSTTIRLVNQRDWDRTADTTSDVSNYDVSLDLGYVTLKEMLYAPLTLNVGRQDLWFGKGFIVGSALLTGAVDPTNSISANEFSDLTAFDAIRATLDYNPLTIDLVYSKVDAGANVADNDDTDLYGINVGYKFNSWNAEAEAYYFNKHDRTTISSPTNVTDTIGGRGSLTPIDNLNIFGELAYQFGDYSATAGTAVVDRSAWATDVGADYTFKTVAWEPKLGFEWIFYSGEEATAGGDWNRWDPVYRGKFDTLIREFLVTLYETDQSDDAAGTSNQHQFLISGSIKPLDSLTAKVVWDIIRADEVYVAGRSKDIGDEVDVQLTYDYTKDVQFGLLAGWFVPGNFYQSPNDKTATEVVGSMKVTF